MLLKIVALTIGMFLGAWIASLIEDWQFRRDMRRAHERAAKR